MKFSRVSVFFLCVLAASLVMKVRFEQEPSVIDHSIVEREITMMLKERGFAVAVEQRSWSPIVRGTKSTCDILVALRDPDGSTKNRIDQLAKPIGSLHYVYRNAITAGPPDIDPMIRGRIIRQIRQFGFRIGRSPVVAVAASSRCNLGEFDWSRLASIP